MNISILTTVSFQLVMILLVSAYFYIHFKGDIFEKKVALTFLPLAVIYLILNAKNDYSLLTFYYWVIIFLFIVNLIPSKKINFKANYLLALIATASAVFYIPKLNFLLSIPAFVLPIITIALSIILLLLFRYSHSYLNSFIFILMSMILDSLLFNDYKYILIALVQSIGIVMIYRNIYLDNKSKHEELLKEYNKLKYEFRNTLRIQVNKRTKQISRLKNKVTEKSKLDPMTKTLNKESIIKVIVDYIKTETEFCLLIFDIDDFKNINDTYGHIVGDKSIIQLADIVRSQLRKSDHFGRFGGDEFIVVVPHISIKDALYVAKKIGKNVKIKTNPNYSISIGISRYPDDGNTYNKLLAVADEGLYKSKEKGKNAITYIHL